MLKSKQTHKISAILKEKQLNKTIITRWKTFLRSIIRKVVS